MEKIIYSDTLNQTELLRTFAKRGISTFGLRVMSSYDLALLILSKLGKTEKRRYLSNQEQDFIYYSLLKPNSFNDASNIRSAINTFRDTGSGNSTRELFSFLLDKYAIKKETIVDAFDKYTKYKKDNNLCDLYDVLYELKEEPQKIAGEVIYYSNLPSSFLALSTFKQYFDLKEEMFHPLSKEKTNISITKCFGKPNELAYVLNTINSQPLPLDKCTVVLLDPNDSVDLITSFKRYDIPYTSSLGDSFSKTDVGRFISLLKEMKDLDYGIDAYKLLFNAPYFNKDKYIGNLIDINDINNLIKYIGWLRPNFEKGRINIDNALYKGEHVDEICNSMQLVCDNINNGVSIFDFIEDNIVNPDNNFEALNKLKQCSDYCKKYHVPFDDVVDNLLNSAVNQHISKSGHIHICSLPQALSSFRENIFIVGLDASFPGNPKENYLIFDEEFIKGNANYFTSQAIVKQNESLMKLLISLPLHCYISYSYFTIVDNKTVNPSSIINAIDLRDADGKKKEIDEFNYASDNLSPNKYLIAKYNDGLISKPNNDHRPYDYDDNILLNKVYKPSQIGNFFNEELRLKFVLEQLFEITIDVEDDTHVVINDADRGTLFHEAVKDFDKKKCSKAQLIGKGMDLFDKYIKQKPPVIKELADKEREYLKRGLENFYDQDPGNIPIYCEKYLKPQPVFDINFKGTFDRLEKDAVGNFILVDYKTGNTPKHKPDDPVTFMQGLIYAEMIKNTLHINVQRCEFRYPFIPQSPSLVLDSDTAALLKSKMKEFYEFLEKGNLSCLLLDDKKTHKYVDQYEHLIALMKELKK